LGFTDLDEKALAAYEEARKRYRNIIKAAIIKAAKGDE
jgi:hypothetical protein